MNYTSKRKIAVLGNYFPRKCGIASFTTDLCEAIMKHQGEDVEVIPIAMNDTAEGYEATLEELDNELGLDTLKVWHFNDSKGSLESHLDRHTHIGEGEIGTEAFAIILNDTRWSGIPMLLETPKEKDLADDVRNLTTLASLVEDTDRIPPGLQPET